MTTAAENLRAIRERFATMDAAPCAGERRLDDVDLQLLAELEQTPPEEKDVFLEQLWKRLHGERAGHVDREDPKPAR